MAYGQDEYGQSGYGGSSFESEGPQLISSSPLPGAEGVEVDAPVSFTIYSPAGLDQNTLRITVNGVLAQLGNEVFFGFGVTTVVSESDTLGFEMALHPDFYPGGNQIDIYIEDNAGNTGDLSLLFTVGVGDTVFHNITISENLEVVSSTAANDEASVVEDLQTHAAYHVDLYETVEASETVSTGSYNIYALGGTSIRAELPIELHFDRVLNLANYLIRPNLKGDRVGNPLTLKGVTLGYTTYQSGSEAAAIPEGSPPDVADERTNILRLAGGTPETFNTGDFIRLASGHNTGLYQILEVVSQGSEVSTVRVDKPLALGDPGNGVHSTEGAASLIGVTNRDGSGNITVSSKLLFRVDHPSVTESDPLQEVYHLERIARPGDPLLEAYNPPAPVPPEEEGETISAASFDLSTIEFLDYRTFSISATNSPLLRGEGSNDFNTFVEKLQLTFQVQSQVDWEHLSGIQYIDFEVSKMLDLGDYEFKISNLYSKFPRNAYSSPLLEFTAQNVDGPRLDHINLNKDEGALTVVFNEGMRQEADNLLNPDDYSITGPSIVTVRGVYATGDRAVTLLTTGMREGEYTLTVSTSTPKDVAGNPLDPIFNTAVFYAEAPLKFRSIYTDKGPIAKSELVSQTGTGAAIDSSLQLTLTGATLTSDDIGKRVRLTGSASNDTTLKILSVLSATTVKVQASLAYPDANSGAIDWEVFDPRNGMIADDPSDVTVRINGDEVTPQAVIGLKGQIVLADIPGSDDIVEVDYKHISNPTVEVRRLNSREFRLNAWNRDIRGSEESGHAYRYNNVLVTPKYYTSADMQATLASPLLRGLKYRAYERKYTASLNDPTTLLLNSPKHRVAFPPLARTLEDASAFFEGSNLPEADSDPWIRHGSGTASSLAGSLTVVDNTTGPAPSGSGMFWTKSVDLTFEHVFSAAWRFSATDVSTYEGVWSGLAAGYSDEKVAYVVGYLEDTGTKKIAFLKRGSEETFGDVSSWKTVDFDWGGLHSYRLFRNPEGRVSLYTDGNIVETLAITPEEAPLLDELNAPFDQVQGAFFGSLSREAENESVWDFYRYLIQPLNALQTSPSVFVSLEGGDPLPEEDSAPWTPVGYHGRAYGDSYLYLESTSASNDSAGLVTGDFKGYARLEPLLSEASQYTFDFAPQLYTHTHGKNPNGLMLAVDDGTRLAQVSFISDTDAPHLSYGGRTLPEDFSPTDWGALGTQTASMVGRTLRIEDSSDSDGKVYFADDLATESSDGRTLASGLDYIFEARFRVESYTADGAGFAGAFVQAFDGTRSLGFMLTEDGGSPYVDFHSDGVSIGASGHFSFNWNDGEFHTYRMRKNAAGDLISLFVDDTLLGVATYSDFSTPGASVTGQLTFGSSTASSAQAQSTVEWLYCNAWRVEEDERRYVGIWKGTSEDDFTDFHIPLKASGQDASIQGNTLSSVGASFLTSGASSGDLLVIDSGPNKGTYEINNVVSQTNLTIVGTWPFAPTKVDFRILKETNWFDFHAYRLNKEANGTLSLFLDSTSEPILQLDVNSTALPSSDVGVVSQFSAGLAAIAFGSFSNEDLAKSSWQYLRYGMARATSGDRIVPPHHILNQWNVVESPERLFTTIPHLLTEFKSSSTGITPNLDPDFLERDDVPAYTQLNQDTPLVPVTQTYQTRSPFASQVLLSTLNNPAEVLNGGSGFTLNNGAFRIQVQIPDDVFYSKIQVIESQEGSEGLIRPFNDSNSLNLGHLYYQKNHCLNYTADTLPEEDAAAPTPWERVADTPGQVLASVGGSVLTYGTSGSTRTAYVNNTPLPDAPSLQTEVTFRIRLNQDGTLGAGDSQVRFGLSAPGMTIGIGFVTETSGARYVNVFDLNSGVVLGYATVDYLDGNYHTYRIVRTPGPDTVEIFIDS